MVFFFIWFDADFHLVEHGLVPVLVFSLAVLCAGDVAVERAARSHSRELFLNCLLLFVVSEVTYIANIFFTFIVFLVMGVVYFTGCVVYCIPVTRASNVMGRRLDLIL